MSEEISNKEYPSEKDPPGTLYVRDGDGEIIVDRRGEPSKARNVLLWIAFGLLSIITVLSVASAIRQNQIEDDRAFDSALTDYELRQSQRINCETGGNVLREDVRKEFVDLKEEVIIPVFDLVAAVVTPNSNRKPPPVGTAPDELPEGTPPGVVLDVAVAYMKKRSDTIEERITDVDCATQYPLLDDPRTEANEAGS
jgi:hypothetical protein